MTNKEAAELEYDWGGDGSDLHKPVRAHVEAALVASDATYPPPLDQLLTLGNALDHWSQVKDLRELSSRLTQLAMSAFCVCVSGFPARAPWPPNRRLGRW